ADAFSIEGVTETGRQDHSVDLEVRQNLQSVLQAAVQYEITDIETRPLTLEEIFLAYYGKGQNGK
ncbi:MAG: ABC transporter ATP-binding protein, partial [Chloroflexota bacterium]